MGGLGCIGGERARSKSTKVSGRAPMLASLESSDERGRGGGGDRERDGERGEIIIRSHRRAPPSLVPVSDSDTGDRNDMEERDKDSPLSPSLSPSISPSLSPSVKSPSSKQRSPKVGTFGRNNRSFKGSSGSFRGKGFQRSFKGVKWDQARINKAAATIQRFYRSYKERVTRRYTKRFAKSFLKVSLYFATVVRNASPWMTRLLILISVQYYFIFCPCLLFNFFLLVLLFIILMFYSFCFSFFLSLFLWR